MDIYDSDQSNMAIATDGSRRAELAFFQGIEFFENNDHYDQIIVVHIFDIKKEYLDLKYTPENVENYYKNQLLSRYVERRYRLVFEQYNPEFHDDLRKQVFNVCDSVNANLLFIGYSGRKGERDELEVLSTNVEAAVIDRPAPVCITKVLAQRNKNGVKGFNFLVLYDGSRKSARALQLSIKLAFNRAQDSITVAYLPTSWAQPEKKERMHNNVKEIMAPYDKELKWTYLEFEPTQLPSKEIIQFVNETSKIDIQFIVCGNNGRRAEKESGPLLGLTMKRVAVKAKANIIVQTQ